ncbi:unnamed protein product, partial [Closterium sp. NIES-53]
CAAWRGVRVSWWGATPKSSPMASQTPAVRASGGRSSSLPAAALSSLESFCVITPHTFVCLAPRAADSRKRLREKYMLPQRPFSDFWMHCLCACCAIAQEHRELRNRGWDPALGALHRMTCHN